MAEAKATKTAETTDEFFPGVSQGKMGMWVFLSSEVAVFGGLIIVYLLYRVGNTEWVEHQRHLAEYIGTFNTLVLLTSSWTIVMSYREYEQDRDENGDWWLLATILLGFLFLGVKAYEWSIEFHHDRYPSTNRFWAFYFAMTGLHGFHVIGGVVTNLLIYLGSVLNIAEEMEYKVEYAGLYWHFVDIVWVFLFPIFYLMFPAAH